MLRYLALRLARAALTIVLVVTFAFVVLRLSGDPALISRIRNQVPREGRRVVIATAAPPAATPASKTSNMKLAVSTRPPKPSANKPLCRASPAPNAPSRT